MSSLTQLENWAEALYAEKPHGLGATLRAYASAWKTEVESLQQRIAELMAENKRFSEGEFCDIPGAVIISSTRFAELVVAESEYEAARADADRLESIIDTIDSAALELTGPWQTGTCYAEAALALPDAYRKLQAERGRLRAAIEGAQHAFLCSVSQDIRGGYGTSPERCDCFKREALEGVKQ